MSDPDGALGAGAAGAPDFEAGGFGDASGGGSAGDPDAMGADDALTVEEGAGRNPGDGVDPATAAREQEFDAVEHDLGGEEIRETDENQEEQR